MIYFYPLNFEQTPYRPKIEVVDDDDEDNNDDDETVDDDPTAESTRLVIDDVSQPDAAISRDVTPQRPITQGDLKSQKLLSELEEIADVGFSARGEINPSVLVPEEVEMKEKSREEKIMELAATAGATAVDSNIPYDEDLEGLD